MLNTDAKDTLRNYLGDYLAHKGINAHKPFNCLCPAHTDKKPSMSYDQANQRVKCFSCGTTYDIYDLIGIDYGLSDFNDQYKQACSLYGISPDNDKPLPVKKKTPPQPKTDYTDFFLQANANLDKTDYHRGISQETLSKYKIGYVDSWKHPKAPNSVPSPRLIIPTSKYSYLARDTRATLTDEQKQYSKQKVGNVAIFNYKCMAVATQPIIIVEGEIDALSVIDAGCDAVALGSVSYINTFVDTVKAQKPTQPFIIALDNDKAGQDATKTLQDRLAAIGCKSYTANITGAYKDANDALMHDKAALEKAINDAVSLCNNTEKEAMQAEKDSLQAECVANAFATFAEHITMHREQQKISTGFASLDAIIGGSLYPGLYTIGAISSLGKTTFVLQIADAIAAAGRDVLMFSLEMDKYELMAKSISRETFINSPGNASTTRDILNGTSKSANAQQAIQDAMERYFNGNVGRHIFIREGIGSIGVGQVKEKVQRHNAITGQAPVVIIDYLQILAPADIRATDKQNTDKAVLELKRLSRDCNTPVIAISSINRSNYTEPINLAAFKESGAIEYSSDILIGLQYDNMDYRDGECEKEREKRVRKLIKDALDAGANGKQQQVQVKVLKNRNGKRGDAVLAFYPMFNCFVDNGGNNG